MFVLATPADVRNFVMEHSPHVKSITVKESEDRVITIRIKLSWWYRLFFEKKFYYYIDELIQDRAMLGFTYDVVLTS